MTSQELFISPTFANLCLVSLALAFWIDAVSSRDLFLLSLDVYLAEALAVVALFFLLAGNVFTRN